MLIPPHLFSPRDFPRTHIPRARLLDLFERYAYARVLLVEATAGYGKSVALTELAQQLHLSLAWYPLERLTQNDSLSFLWNLVRAVQVSLPDFGQEITSLLEAFAQGRVQGQEGLKATLLPVLAAELSALHQPLMLILENYHVLLDEEIEQLLIYLIEYTPATVSFVITSRQTLQWAIRPRWEGQDILVALSDQELAFTIAESQELAQLMGVRITEAQAAEIHAATGGWPILHYFLYQNLRNHPPHQLLETLKILAHPSEVIYRYLAEELLQKETPIARDFLCRTSVLQELDEATCDALLGVKIAAQTLNQLKNSLFISRVGQSFVHSHDITRQFLQQVLQREYGEAEVANLCDRLGSILEEQSKWDEAVAAYSQGKHYARISRLVEQQAPLLLSIAQFTRLDRWLSHVPPSWLEEEPILLVYRGLVLADQRNPLAAGYLQRAIQLWEEEGDQRKVTWAKGELGWLYWSSSRFMEGSEVLADALRGAQLDPRFEAKGHHYMALTLHGLDRYEEALQHGNQAIALLRHLDTPEDKMALTRLLRHLSYVYISLGHIRAAAQLVEEARSLAQALSLGEWAIAWINNQLAEIYRHLGRFEEAHTYLDEADTLLARYRELGARPILLDFITNTRGHLYRDTYDYDKAVACYQLSTREQSGLFLSLRILQPNHAAEGLELALAEWQRTRQIESPVDRAKFQALVGIAYLVTGDDAQASFHLEAALKVVERFGERYSAVTFRFYLASLCFKQGDETQGKSNLSYALEAMESQGYYNLDIWHPVVVAEMVARAIQADIKPEFAMRLVTKRLAAQYAAPFLPLVNHQEPRVRQAALELLGTWPDTIETEARCLLNTCTYDPQTRARLLGWFNAGWLTPPGLLRLKESLSWRQAEVFLLWLCPRIHGSIQNMAAELLVTVDTVNTHLKNARQLLETSDQSVFPRRKGAHAAVYDWAIREGIVNPHHSSSC